ncbi:unnamed protein product [Brassica rapa]|uniref:Uncharacterized protein n=1 Tax=Brassica campestris TaxID=3711 RepID=A0A3P5YU40_BRACM|nr:unnamed protein product [Brassica rapa]VDC67144.1 unnamed protein product [Brassica rapa]
MNTLKPTSDSGRPMRVINSIQCLVLDEDQSATVFNKKFTASADTLIIFLVTTAKPKHLHYNQFNASLDVTISIYL